MSLTDSYDVVIIGAGAAGLMCAIEAGKRGRKVLVLDHANKAGKKILMSGGGRCNFTNLHIDPENYLSHNPHFCKSAFSRYTQWDFIAMVERHGIAYHEKHLGQLFCDNSSKDILGMLLDECRHADVAISLNSRIESVQGNTADGARSNRYDTDRYGTDRYGTVQDGTDRDGTDQREPDRCDTGRFTVVTADGVVHAESLVVACGGLSIPKMCATPFGYRLAQQFGHKIWPTSAGLVPFTLHEQDKQRFASLSGVSADSLASNERASFRENILFTHRGISGPAVLQISSYWQPGEAVTIHLLPDINLLEHLNELRKEVPARLLKTALSELLPKKLVTVMVPQAMLEKPLQECSRERLQQVADSLQNWQLRPNGTEGYRTAEVTLGGVDCDQLSSKTMESTLVSGLYFIGEVVDVTGWLGGYNFQWAWSSGWCAGQVV